MLRGRRFPSASAIQNLRIEGRTKEGQDAVGKVRPIIGVLMMIFSVFLWIWVGTKSNDAKDSYKEAETNNDISLEDTKNLIACASRTVKRPTSEDEAYSITSDSLWPITLISVLIFVVGLLFVLLYFIIVTNTGRG